MIHLKSTLAVSAIMLSGLVAASPFPYRADEQPRKPRPAAALQAATVAEASAPPAAVTAWADPPAKAQPPAEPSVPAVAAVAPIPTAEPTAIAAPVTPPVRHVSLQGPAQTKAEQARRRKAARAVRERQMAAQQSAPEAQVAAREVPSTPQRIDPIGDILRGLGIGRES